MICMSERVLKGEGGGGGSRAWIPGWAIGEFWGTLLLVFFGCGSVAASVTTGAQVGVFQVAIVWGLGIAIAISLCGGLSGAHLNPAVTLSLMVWSGFSWRRGLLFMVVQVVGAFVGALLVFAVFHEALADFESRSGLVRGETGSEGSAMVFGEFYPNPGGEPLTDARRERMGGFTAFGAEVLGTAILVLVIYCVVDPQNGSRPRGATAAAIGLTVTVLISILGPLTMACFNPARDLGPRVFSAFAGWGALPFRVNGLGWLTVYIVAPLLGGVLGGGIYHYCFRPGYRGGAQR